MATIDIRFINNSPDTHAIAIFQKNVAGSALALVRDVKPGETRELTYDLHPSDSTVHVSLLRDLHDTVLATPLDLENEAAPQIVMRGEDPYTFELAGPAAPEPVEAEPVVVEEPVAPEPAVADDVAADDDESLRAFDGT